MLFDTHAHYDAEQFSQDAREILGKLPEEGVSLVVNIGCDLESSQKSIDFAEAFPHVYATVGFHPSELGDTCWNQSVDKLKSLAQHPKVKAIGEIGLDYYWENNPPKPKQLKFFHGQMELAEELQLPVVIHDREAHQDSLQVVTEHKNVGGVFHCYSGSVEMAKTLLDLGYYLSFTGVVTYKNAKKVIPVVDYVPLDRMLIETDSPYLSPEPKRGKRNDSRHLRYTAEKIAEVKGISWEEVAKITTENGKKFYNIP